MLALRTVTYCTENEETPRWGRPFHYSPEKAELHGTQHATADSRVGAVSLAADFDEIALIERRWLEWSEFGGQLRDLRRAQAADPVRVFARGHAAE